MHRSTVFIALLVVHVALVGPVRADPSVQEGARLVAAVEPYDVARVAAAIGDRRIVLLGENGHGVAAFSAIKAELVRYLHEHLGFEVVAFESGFHECRRADARITTQSLRATFHDCLIYQLEHAEIEPLLAYARSTRGTARPLVIAGIDLQVQGVATRTRPAFLRAALHRAPSLADSVARLDSILIERALASPDSMRAWVREHGRDLKVLYDSGAALTTGDTSWTFRTASALMRRELHRVAALSFGLDAPSDVYAIRDEWMARTIAHLAGGEAGTRKVVVWLHNDHARYGEWRAGPLRVRAAGQLVRDWFPEQVCSVGFLMGGGTFADNSRRARTVPDQPAGSIEATMRRAGFPVAFLRLGPSASREVRDWAGVDRPYIRGPDIFRMRPGHEFDALIYVDRVSVANFVQR